MGSCGLKPRVTASRNDVSGACSCVLNLIASLLSDCSCQLIWVKSVTGWGSIAAVYATPITGNLVNLTTRKYSLQPYFRSAESVVPTVLIVVPIQIFFANIAYRGQFRLRAVVCRGPAQVYCSPQ